MGRRQRRSSGERSCVHFVCRTLRSPSLAQCRARACSQSFSETFARSGARPLPPIEPANMNDKKLRHRRNPMEPKIVTPAEWTEARKALLVKEKEFNRLRDELSRQRRELPWERVEKSYTFEAPRGKVTLAELFGERSQLIVYHFMLGPEMKEGCPGCSFVADH